MIDDAHRALIDSYIDAYNRFDIDGMLNLVTDDVRFEHHTGDELSVATNGKAELEKLARVGAALFASRTQKLVEMHEEGKVVMATIDFHGEIAEDIPDGPGAGTIIEMQGTSEFGFSGGKINRIIDRG
jgi:ketosteroid isomerase-like protein